MARQKRKKNHWVAQSYLRAFAADPADPRKIWTLSRTGGEPELKPIEKVAVRFYLYAPVGPAGRDYQFEEKLSSLEQLFGLRGWAENASGFVDLRDSSMRKGLALLTAVMYLRNPLRLAVTHDTHRSLVDFYSHHRERPKAIEIKGQRYALDTTDWPAYRDATDDDIKRMWLEQVGSAVWLAEIMMGMRWAVQFSETPVFITTDNPVTVVHPSLRFRGFRNPETAVIFPLSPTRVLVMDNRHAEPDGQYYRVRKSAPNVNTVLWRESIDRMFSSRHPDHVCAEMLQDAERRGFGSETI